MADINQFHNQVFDEFEPNKKLSDTLNVLTILSLIWSGISAIYAFFSYATICKSILKLNQTTSQMQGGGWLADMAKHNVEMMERLCEVRIPYLVATIATTLMCVVGVIMMRRLKKAGFFIYIIGELGFPAISYALIGGTILHIVWSAFFPVLFAILFATQTKYLTK
jgi:hypothetical protein